MNFLHYFQIGLATSVTPWPLYDPEDTELENIVQELVEKVDQPTEEKQQGGWLYSSEILCQPLQGCHKISVIQSITNMSLAIQHLKDIV